MSRAHNSRFIASSKNGVSQRNRLLFLAFVFIELLVASNLVVTFLLRNRMDVKPYEIESLEAKSKVHGWLSWYCIELSRDRYHYRRKYVKALVLSLAGKSCLKNRDKSTLFKNPCRSHRNIAHEFGYLLSLDSLSPH